MTHPAWFETGEGAPDFRPFNTFTTASLIDYTLDVNQVFDNLYLRVRHEAKEDVFSGLLGRKKKDDDKPMTMTQRKAEEVKNVREPRRCVVSQSSRGRTASTTAVINVTSDKPYTQNAANMAMVKKDRPMPKSPSATSLANAATPKPTVPQSHKSAHNPPSPKADAPAKQQLRSHHVHYAVRSLVKIV